MFIEVTELKTNTPYLVHINMISYITPSMTGTLVHRFKDTTLMVVENYKDVKKAMKEALKIMMQVTGSTSKAENDPNK